MVFRLCMPCIGCMLCPKIYVFLQPNIFVSKSSELQNLNPNPSFDLNLVSYPNLILILTSDLILNLILDYNFFKYHKLKRFLVLKMCCSVKSNQLCKNAFVLLE